MRAGQFRDSGRPRLAAGHVETRTSELSRGPAWSAHTTVIIPPLNSDKYGKRFDTPSAVGRGDRAPVLPRSAHTPRRDDAPDLFPTK